jgi:hypothetical protein
MRAFLLSFQTYYEEQMLYHLPHIQLGPPYDAIPHDIYKGLLFALARAYSLYRMGRMGELCISLPRALLGAVERRPQMLGVHRQALHTVLQKIKAKIKKYYAFRYLQSNVN